MLKSENITISSTHSWFNTSRTLSLVQLLKVKAPKFSHITPTLNGRVLAKSQWTYRILRFSLSHTRLSPSLNLLISITWSMFSLLAALFRHLSSPHLRRKAVADKMLDNISAHPDWPSYAEVFEHPPSRLTSRCPIWSDQLTYPRSGEKTGRRLLWSIMYSLQTLYYPTTRIRPTSSLTVSAESLLDRSGPLSLQPTQMGCLVLLQFTSRNPYVLL